MALNEDEQDLISRFKKFDLLDQDYAYPFIDFCDNVIKRDYDNRKPVLDMCNKIKNEYYQMLVDDLNLPHSDERDARIQEGFPIFWGILKMESQNRQFDSYLMYLEKNRDPKEKFYQPRRSVLRKHGIVQAYQRLLDDDKLKILGISLPPSTGKTSLEKFFHSAVCGWFPLDGNLFYSHSGDITKMYYNGMLDILTNNEEYLWGEIFPDLHVTSTDAKREQINIGGFKSFPNVQCTSVGARNAGKVRCSRFLLVDDLIGSQEEALNKNYLEKLWSVYYTVDANQRKEVSKVDGWDCKELHNATRWSNLDPLGRLSEMYADSDTALFISVPALDEHEQSNFMYDVGGFTTEHYLDLRMKMDDISWNCLFQQQPMEREGLLYQDDELRRFKDLPNREPDAILGVCDTKEKGTDFMFLPMFYKYDNDYYLVDCICDDTADFNVQYGRLTDIIMRHNAQQVEFESNQGGARIAFEVQDRIKKQGGICNITTKPTETNKETRIIVNSDWIKQNCLFLDKGEYSVKSDYGRMMSFLLSYSVSGKNKHDDVPDGLANFALFVGRKLTRRETHYGAGLF